MLYKCREICKIMYVGEKSKKEIKVKMKKEAVKTVSKKVVSVLDAVLKVEANSTSCWLIYQPKEPKKIDRFKRSNK